MTALTSDIAAFVATVDPSAVPERCNFGARIGMLDCVGTMIAGSDEEAVQIVSRMVATSTWVQFGMSVSSESPQRSSESGVAYPWLRTRRPGRAPVSSPCSKIVTPATSVAR